MAEVLVQFPGCSRCRIPFQQAHGSIALNSGHGAVLTCYHGPVYEREKCKCVPKPDLVTSNGEVLQLTEIIQSRDVAWLTFGRIQGTARELSNHTPASGEEVTVSLPGGPVKATVRGVVGRDDPQTGELELDLATTFPQGESGSPVLDAQGRVIAVVRNTDGRCGFVQARPRPAPVCQGGSSPSP